MITITPLRYNRKEIYSLEDIFKHVERRFKDKDSLKVVFDGDSIRVDSDRYKVFKFKGVHCVECGIEGKYFAKEQSIPNKHTPEHQINSWHFNLYALDENGNEVLMTKDHIMPKSKGGEDKFNNYQPMCSICNHEKSNKYN